MCPDVLSLVLAPSRHVLCSVINSKTFIRGYSSTYETLDTCNWIVYINFVFIPGINSATFRIFRKKDESMVMPMLSIGVGQASIKRASVSDTFQISKVHIKFLRNEFNSYPLCKYNLAKSV